MDVAMHDERAAGVVHGADPYKELELYLAKVNEEIGEVFDRWHVGHVDKPAPLRVEPTPTLPTLPKRKVTSRRLYRDDAVSKWSDTLLAEFNSIIEQELSHFQAADERTTQDADHVTMRIKSSSDNYDLAEQTECQSGAGTPPSASASADSSPSLHQRSSKLARMLRKHRTQLPPGEAPTSAAVLVRVASLPDADVFRENAASTASSHLDVVPRPRNAHSFSEHRRPARSAPDIVQLPITPELPVKVDRINPKQLPNSDNGLIMQSPVLVDLASKLPHEKSPVPTPPVRTVMMSGSKTLPTSRAERACVKHNILHVLPFSNITLPELTPDPAECSRGDGDVTSQRPLPTALHNFLTRIRPARRGGPSRSPPMSSRVYLVDGSLSPVDAGTQTSPALSRSSSFTWVSDCSSLLLHSPDSDTLDDDNRSSSSSSSSASPPLDDFSSRDSLLSSSPPESTERDDESGIGTASPPRQASKARRKETWERLRKRPLGRPPRAPSQEVWIRRENVETQTNEDARSLEELDSSSGRDETTTPDGLDSDVGDSLPRLRPPRPQCLAVTPQHSGHPNDHPSPSTASLKLTATPLPAELASKSSSAPLLVKQPALQGGTTTQPGCHRSPTQPRSQSERHLAEIEAGEACKWLRAAGFPQYAQMYEDLQFPVDVSGVQKDHPFLDCDSLQSLYRRLSALNRCAKMKLEQNKPCDDSDDDEDNCCALSENWTFQPDSRRWSRVCEVAQMHSMPAPSRVGRSTQQQELDEEEEDEEEEGLSHIPVISPLRYGSLPPGNQAAGDADLMAVRFRRTGSERLRDGAKALLRRMESLKSRRRKRLHREGIVISEPRVCDETSMSQRMRDMNCVDVSPTSPHPPSPLLLPTEATPLPVEDEVSPVRRARSKTRREETASDSEMQRQPSWRQQYMKDANSNHTKVLEFVDGRSRGTKDREPRTQTRSGSLNLGRDSQRYRDKYHQHSLRRERDRRESNSQADSDLDDSQVTLRNKSSVVRWHSFQRGSLRPASCLLRAAPGSPPMSSLSCGQLLVLRKLALLKLTSCMERFCPTHRTGWTWELPKFIRKIKAPDYKDKTVFGVPLLVSLQRSGQALPSCIQAALRWLRGNALDQVGLFRKSGVRSRIQRLKLMTESQGGDISYDQQQAYDVADMLKQYFRELPEALLTNKLSETFIAIFQHVPSPLRHEAVQCVLLLLPDEHREALHTLLDFLGQVAAQSSQNQMTASNLAVCLAPSLFHLHHAPRSASASPRRKTAGSPDPRELGENRAAHDCLLYLIKEHKNLFMVVEDLMNQCHFSYMEQSVPVALEELGAEFQQDWRGYLYACTTALLKEAREKNRGWMSVACNDSQVDMSYRKVGDGHPLRLWRVSTEVEAPPLELLQRVLRERHVWDHSLLKWRIVQPLDQHVEVFQYVCASMQPSPARDFCVIRSWRSDLPKGACVIVETSVEHPDGAVMLGGVRGIVLASRYLIEPCGSGRSRIMHLSRVDTKGRTPEWYNKSYGHICALHLSRIRDSLRHTADGPESKV